MRMLRFGGIVLAAVPAALGCSGTSGVQDGEAAAAARPEDRRYELPAPQVWAAAQAAVEEDGGAVELRRPASDGGEIVARRPEGARVQAIVTAVGPTAARASVAVTPPNTTLAAMVQGRIGERLSLQKAQAELFGETSVETVYPRSLEASVAAAEETCRSLDLEIVRHIIQESHARVEGRDRKSRAVRFSFRRIGNGETAVMFTAEVAGEDVIEHLRREFERHLFQ